jgi:hypothetical protein
MELCRNGEGIPFVRLPGFDKHIADCDVLEMRFEKSD